MMTVEQVAKALKDRRMDMVSDATGLHENTIRAIRDGHTKDPSFGTMQRLCDYLEGKPIEE
jgi:DNA-binding Xre family transcriptional regulator